MPKIRIGLIYTVVVAGIGLLVAFVLTTNRLEPDQKQTQRTILRKTSENIAQPNVSQNRTNATITPKRKIRLSASDFSEDEWSQFLSDFKRRYKPAVSNWCAAYEGHIPFSSDDVTPGNFVERISKNSSFAEYVFVVNGITLAVQVSGSAVRVDYLNDPRQTRKLASLPAKADAPITSMPVSREDMTKMLKEDSGISFAPAEIRMKPTGFSGKLNGGAFVHVGGDPENGASWKYDFVFGQDGKIAYYLKGRD
ncbi:MAG TPA: hypothetical protein VFM25_07040 [Verrucomicrobiae bacterium]|nr:hypothetical protein [Verrucomicrobiae bacterium]